jgi:hypothetical protein
LIQPLVKLIARPHLLARVARLIPGASIARSFSALLSNTAAATVVRAGAKTNVIPGVAEFEIDGPASGGSPANIVVSSTWSYGPVWVD